MTDQELSVLRKAFVHGENEKLKELYLEYKTDCLNVLHRKKMSRLPDSEDIYTDAILIFRDNIVSGKIVSLTSAKSYLISTCMNLAKEKLTYATKRTKKLQEVRLLFYERKHTMVEGEEIKRDLIRITQKALKKLSVDCQKILIAFYIYKIPMKELAEEFGLLNANVVKTKKLRCYKLWIKKTKSLMHTYATI